jgi:eukaryotic-like serine/threonine-protein kinase
VGSTTVADPLAGTVLDRRYRVDGPVARGGMSTVYAGTDLRLDRRVAVKVMAPALAHDPTFTDRFVREARSAARLSHPNAVAVFDQGAEDVPAGRVVFLVMELVRGGTLRDLLRRRGRLRPDEAVALLEPVLGALAAAHRAGLVHRDVKPENVLIAPDGTVKVADFGLARAVAAPSTSTQAGVVLGTVAYVAPEQVVRGAADPRTDVYSAGILLYELLTGVPPYSGDSAIAVAYRHVHDDVPPPSQLAAGVPAALDELVLRATRREPGARPADAGVFLAELGMARADAGLRPAPLAALAPPPPPTLDLSPVVGPPGGPASTGGIEPAPTGVLGAGSSSGSTTALPAWAAGPAVAGPAGGRAGTSGTGRVGWPGGGPGGATAAGWSGGAGGATVADWPGEQRARRRRGALALLLVLLLAAGTGGAAWWFGTGRFVEVPPLADLSERAAQERLAGAGLGSEVSREPSDTVDAGRVVRSDPGSGDRVLRGRTITVVVSSGVPRVTVPDVVGKTRDEAESQLRAVGLVPRVVTRPDDDVDEGVVLDQESAGETVERGSAVQLTVSAGDGRVEVPNVLGQSIDSARRQLEDAGFEVRVRSLRIGNVIRQSPRAGSERQPGSTVTIYGL